MGLDLSKFSPFGALADLGKSLIERLIPDPAMKAQALQKLAEMQQTGELAQLAADTDLAKGQLDINKIEAASPLTFISGWRPAVGWVCVAAFAVNYVVGPIFAWGAAVLGRPFVAPVMNMAEIMPVLLGILGLGAYRSFDKSKGAASK